MRLLLTSSGITNPSINEALVDLLGKPISEASALCIPTAIYPFPGGPFMAGRMIRGLGRNPLCGLGWESLGVLELTALPTISEDVWAPMVQETDALLVLGGDPLYLSHWIRQSGLGDLLPSLHSEAVYVGVSAGAMAATPTSARPTLNRPGASAPRSRPRTSCSPHQMEASTAPWSRPREPDLSTSR